MNDLIMLVAVRADRAVPGDAARRRLTVPFQVLLYSVIVFIVIPLAAGTILRALLVRRARQRVVREDAAAALRAGDDHGAARRRWCSSSPFRPTTSPAVSRTCC